MGNSEQKEKEEKEEKEEGMSILICGGEKVGKHVFMEALSTPEFKKINLDEYRGRVVLKNKDEIESTLYIKSDLKDRIYVKRKKSYYSRKFDKINAAVFVFDFSKFNSFRIMKHMIKDFEKKRPGFGVAIIGNKYVENEKQPINLIEAQTLAIQNHFDYYSFYDYSKLEGNVQEKQIIKDMDEIKEIYEKVYHKMPKKGGCC